MIELELTFLAKSLPPNLKNCPAKKIVDLYVEGGSIHSSLRIRRNGEEFELTRKAPVEAGDASKQSETTISLNQSEFESLSSTKSREIEKTRYFFDHEGRTAEFDVFEGGLKGLIVIDFEFENEAEKASFAMPGFCLAEITQETFIAGGVLAGKSYDNISEELEKFCYQKLQLA
jgi:CYTH domain-containing protein